MLKVSLGNGLYGLAYGEINYQCHATEPLSRSVDGLHYDDKLRLSGPIEITDREVERLMAKQYPISHGCGLQETVMSFIGT
ncbi:hypothetical protein Tco_0237002 [Tanacetum coccineum]